MQYLFKGNRALAPDFLLRGFSLCRKDPSLVLPTYELTLACLFGIIRNQVHIVPGQAPFLLILTWRCQVDQRDFNIVPIPPEGPREETGRGAKRLNRSGMVGWLGSSQTNPSRSRQPGAPGNQGERAARGSRVQPALMRAGLQQIGEPLNQILPAKTVEPLFLTRRRGEAVERGFPGPAGPQVDEPVHAAHHQSAANDVTDGCRQQIVPQEIPPGQNGPAVL